MYGATLIIDTDVLEFKRKTIREFPGRLGIYTKTVIQPRLQLEVSNRLGVDPGPVKRPFIFATAKSRRFYFAMMRGRLPYRRTGELRRAWTVKIDLRQNEGLVSIFNKRKEAVYVYGPGFLITNRRQVPGHKRTGWGKNFDNELLRISQIAQDLLIDACYTIGTGEDR